MTSREWIEAAPDDALIPARLAKAALREPAGVADERVLSSVEAARLFGKSAEWWQDAARAGNIPGAWQEGRRGPWNLPIAGCRAHLAGLKGPPDAPRPVRKVSRGPWKKTA